MASEMKLSPRVVRLRSALEKEFAETKRHMLVREDQQRAFAEIHNHAYIAGEGQAEVLRRAGFLIDFAENFPVAIGQDESSGGSQRFTHPDWGKYLTRNSARLAETIPISATSWSIMGG